MRSVCLLLPLLFVFAQAPLLHAQPRLSLDKAGAIAWTSGLAGGIVTVEISGGIRGPWSPTQNFYNTNGGGRASIPLNLPRQYVRLRQVDAGDPAHGFENLVGAYGIIETVAGSGIGRADGISFWDPSFEGGPAVEAGLSRPHFAMADLAGNIYIADKDSHAILKAALDGTIHTVAGTHEEGDNGDGPAPATTLQLNNPNGLWVTPGGTVYILDTDNGKVRKVTPQGILTTLFKVSGGISGGRGIWVSPDETLAYFSSGTDLKKWTRSGGVKTLNNNFTELGNFIVQADGTLVVTDRGAHMVYRVSAAGNRTPLAGNGTTLDGGDGYPALETGLAGVRGVWAVPSGGYLLATHQGSQVWFLDTAGILHLMVDGLSGGFHDGDGDYFYTPSPKISEVRSVTMDWQGNILITENDAGFIRRIRFSRM